MEQSEGLPLYPPRPTENLDQTLDLFQAAPDKLLVPEERQKVLALENTLGTELEKIWGPKVNTIEFYTAYFLTPAGHQTLTEILGEELAQFTREEDIEKHLVATDLSKIDSKKLELLSGASRKYADSVMLEQLRKNNFSSIDGVENPNRINILLNPEVLAKKLAELRQFKAELKTTRGRIKGDSTEEAKLVILEMYQDRANELIIEHYADAMATVDKSEINPESLSEAEKVVLKQVRGLETFIDQRRARSLSRLDKYAQGAGRMDPETKNFTPINEKLFLLAQELREKSKSQSAVAEHYLAEGISPEVLKSYRVNAETLQEWMEKMAEHYNILSSEPAETYNFQRDGSAADGKWQLVIDPRRDSFNVDSRQKVGQVPALLDRSLSSITPTGGIPLADHEFTHVIQCANSEPLDLKITENIGMAQSSIVAEAGAIVYETLAQREIFGQERPVNLHYLAAIEERLRGGDYRQCVLAFFNSCMIAEPNANKEAKAKLAIDRARRIFRRGGRYEDTTPNVTNSEPLVYVEQELLAQQVAKRELPSLLLVGGVNLETLAKLRQFGLVNLDKMIIPDKLSAELIWPEVEKELWGKA